MATLQKFKLFATPCGVAQSPTQSPRTSPLVQFRRHKTTLQSLLWLNRSSRRRDSPLLQEHSSEKKGRNSLKELFVSSPPREEVEEKLHVTSSTTVLGSVAVGNPGWMGFRYRSLLKRKAWRPLLLTIHE
ncbi:PREDICTED: uncharacterized protein LOC109335403 [Lupinus angustifolius]|uniref:uncharacterized protein LOC109335403 n=1 Tax=Lupinus angustifolius TaxID=3871 RepID=UPI00092F1AE9|nr:PREDICTED: uncharacterized protein LOC109335403 [Lupinus angustifolius]